MAEFSPNQSVMAKATLPVKPSGMVCEAELYLGEGRAATSGRIPFTSTGASQSIQLPIVMPPSGSYQPLLDIFTDNTLIGAFYGTESVVIKEVVEFGVIDFGELEIIKVGGKDLINVSGHTAELAEPITKSDLKKGITVTFRSKTIDYNERSIIGLAFNMTYEGTGVDITCGPGYGPAFRSGNIVAPLYCPSPEGCPPYPLVYTGEWTGIANIGQLYGHGYYCPVIYNGSFSWAKLYWDTQLGGGEFYIKNMVRCTGTGQTF